MARERTRLMREVEERYGKPLDRLLPDMYNEKGLLAMAEELGVSTSTLWYWFLKFGITVRRVALAPGETLEIVELAKSLVIGSTGEPSSQPFVVRVGA